MKKQIKNVEVSAHTRFGRPSEMDKEVKYWTEKGWTLTNTVSGKGNRYLVTFEYVPSEEEVRKQRERSRNTWLIGIAIVVILGAVSVVNNAQQAGNVPIAQTAQAVVQVTRDQARRNQLATNTALQASIDATSTVLQASNDITSTFVATERLAQQRIAEATHLAEAFASLTQQAINQATSNANATLTTFTPTTPPTSTPIPSSTPLPTSTTVPSNTPMPTSTPAPTSTPRPTEAPQGTRDNPHAGLGEIRDGRFGVNSIQIKMTSAVLRMSFLNREPDTGEEWVVANVTFYCDLPSDEICNTTHIDFELVGQLGELYDTELIASIDNAFGGEVFGGGHITGNVGYIVDSSDTRLLVVIHDLSTRTYFRNS